MKFNRRILVSLSLFLVLGGTLAAVILWREAAEIPSYFTSEAVRDEHEALFDLHANSERLKSWYTQLETIKSPKGRLEEWAERAVGLSLAGLALLLFRPGRRPPLFPVSSWRHFGFREVLLLGMLFFWTTSLLYGLVRDLNRFYFPSNADSIMIPAMSLVASAAIYFVLETVLNAILTVFKPGSRGVQVAFVIDVLITLGWTLVIFYSLSVGSGVLSVMALLCLYARQMRFSFKSPGS